MKRFASFSLFFVLLLSVLVPATAQVVGNSVRLSASNPQGVPVHPQAGQSSYVRWSNGTKGKVTSIDPASGWFKIESEGQSGWVTKTYLTVINEDPDADDEGGTNEALQYVLGTWNLEWFKDGANRGFPEYQSGGPTYGTRSAADYAQIAGIIRTQIFAKLLVLNEINGASASQSVEMNRLLGLLGQTWRYDLSSAGSQRIAVLYDTTAVRKDSMVELSIPEEIINGKDIFDRDPLVGKFTLLDKNGAARNDLLVVAVHLASGQALKANHNKAMAVLRDRLHQLIADGTLPSGERDVLIMGDFNANRYDTSAVEDFWTGYDDTKFKFRTLAPEDQDDYFPTRLAGVPLAPLSRIDYILGSGQANGIIDELVQLTAHVHSEILPTDVNQFRAHVSDHLPVTVRVRVVTDDD